MFINAAQPKAVWGDGVQQQGNLNAAAKEFAFESQLRQSQRAINKKLLLRRQRLNQQQQQQQQELQQQLQQQLQLQLRQLTPNDIKAWSVAVSQGQPQAFPYVPPHLDHRNNTNTNNYSLRHQSVVPPRPTTTKMEFPSLYVTESGDESYLTEDLYSGFSGIGLDTPNPGRIQQQTTATAGYVSGPPSQSHNQLVHSHSHSHHVNGIATNNNSSGNKGTWSLLSEPAMYQPHIFDSPHCYSMFDNGYLTFTDGLPGAWDQNMPILGETTVCSNGSHRISPGTSVGSSFSSVDSDQYPEIASVNFATPMSIDPTPLAHGHGHAGASNWPYTCEPTISPKSLRINPSPVPAPNSSTESFHTILLPNAGEWGSNLDLQSQSQSYVPTVSKKASSHARKELPDKPKARKHPSLVDHFSSKHKPIKPSIPTSESVAEQTLTQRHKIVQPRPQADSESQATEAADKMMERSKKDEFLVKSKQAGMTYKEIRRKGGFTEAESTLRGRYRTLTKEKQNRVRKPEWSDNDIRLLKKAVRKLGKGNDTAVKVPWKLVAEYIADHGGYHFGNATCRKRWDELVEQGKASLQ